MKVFHRYIEEGMFTPPDANSLLIGTFPSVLIREKFGRIRPTDVDFFYGSIDNNFWQDLSTIYHRTFLFERSEEAVQQRKELLNDLKLALSDCIAACETSGSAMDTALQNIDLNTGLIEVLDHTPTVTKLFFTSSSGKINAESLTMRILKESGRMNKMQITQKAGPRMRQLLYVSKGGQQRIINTVTLYSPSPLAEQWGGITKEKRIAQYQLYLPKLSR